MFRVSELFKVQSLQSFQSPFPFLLGGSGLEEEEEEGGADVETDKKVCQISLRKRRKKKVVREGKKWTYFTIKQWAAWLAALGRETCVARLEAS